MKSQIQAEQIILSQPSSIIESQKIQRIQSKTCVSNNQAHYVCINSTCQNENAIMCVVSQCSCKLSHQYCIKAELKSIINAIQSRAKPLKQFQQIVNNIFENAIDKLSVARDNIIESHRQLFLQKTYFPKQSYLLNLLKSNSLNELKGSYMYEIASNINIRKNIGKLINDSKEWIFKQQQKIITYTNAFCQQIENILLKLQRYFANQKSDKTIDLSSSYLFKFSQIIKTNAEQKLLQSFFQKNIFQSTLLYRASQNNFSGDKFHQLCEDIPNILILIRTQKDKLIGAYTPLTFPSTHREAYLSDPQRKSFMFSLTEGDKLSLTSTQNAIMNQKNSEYILRFGGGSDLRISNHANANGLSYAAISTSYRNSKYSGNSESYLKFSGCDSIYFKISEWEVWKLVLQ